MSLLLWTVRIALLSVAAQGCPLLESPTGGTGGGGGSAGGGNATGTVKLYVSVGDAGDCWRYDPSQCQISEVSFDLGDRKALSERTVVSNPGVVAPAISPDGSWISYDRLSGSSMNVTVRALDPTTAKELSLGRGSKSAWITNDALVYGTSDEDPEASERWSNIVRADIERQGTTATFEGSTVVLGGKNTASGFDTSDSSGEDPEISPSNSSLVSVQSSPWWYPPTVPNCPQEHSCPWLEGMPTTKDLKNTQVAIFDMNATKWTKGQTWWPFALPTAGIEGCAHTAFSPSGNKVACTDQPITYTEQATAGGTSYTVGYGRVYAYHKVGESYVSDRGQAPMFDHLRPDQLPEIGQIWDPSPQKGNLCHQYYTKRATFCGSEDVILVTAHCGDTSVNPALPGFGFSRTYLIDASNPSNPVYTDVTSAIEDLRGKQRGALSSYTATCTTAGGAAAKSTAAKSAAPAAPPATKPPKPEQKPPPGKPPRP